MTVTALCRMTMRRDESDVLVVHRAAHCYIALDQLSDARA